MNTTALTYQSELQFYFSDNEKRISNAIRNINQINELKIHDENIQGKDDYNVLEVIVFLAMQKGYKFPLAFLIDELKAQTDNKWLEVNNCISTTIQSDVSQLIIYFRIDSKNNRY
ncbi:hypothetical protein [Treponema sp.]|uniref:hypothetical protein n=1 Tax=Treponema sp. TaxID=166 RepID=UPI0025D841FF|nr:hypothetical protein [Treponema sp.]MBR4320877.1 hypothetical protein [Treponema sp.]